MSFIAQLINWFTQLDSSAKFLVIMGVLVILFLVIGIIGGIADMLETDDRYNSDRE